MTRERAAACACGQLTAVCHGDPVLVSACSCAQCQKRTGSAFGIAAFFDRGSVETTGRSMQHTRASDSGQPVTFHFCPDCGSTVSWYPARMPDVVAIAVGAFADPDFPAPTQDVHRESRHRWVTFPTRK